MINEIDMLRLSLINYLLDLDQACDVGTRSSDPLLQNEKHLLISKTYNHYFITKIINAISVIIKSNILIIIIIITSTHINRSDEACRSSLAAKCISASLDPSAIVLAALISCPSATIKEYRNH
jgi:hypothetical protein